MCEPFVCCAKGSDGRDLDDDARIRTKFYGDATKDLPKPWPAERRVRGRLRNVDGLSTWNAGYESRPDSREVIIVKLLYQRAELAAIGL